MLEGMHLKHEDLQSDNSTLEKDVMRADMFDLTPGQEYVLWVSIEGEINN